jgi:cation:H+ antiporter
MITRWIFGEPGLGPLLVEFCVCTGFVIVAGMKLSRYGHWIGEVTGLGGAWIGVVFLACVTSLPELATAVGTVAAVGGVHGADLAFGDLFGSCAFNLLIIALLDALSRHKSPLALGTQGQVLTAAGGALILGVAAVGLVVMHGTGAVPPGFGWVFSVLIVVSYLVMVRLTFKYERAHPDERDEVSEAAYRGTNSGLYTRFAVAAVVIVATGLWLAEIGAALAAVEVRVGAGTFRLGESFVGTLFLAASTSMPEVVVTVAAFRIGAANMALGNLFGSNVFNVAIIPVCDAVSGGRLFERGSLSNLIPLSLSVVMTGVAILGLAYRPRKTPARFGLDSAALAVVYVLGMIVLFCSGAVGH